MRCCASSVSTRAAATCAAASVRSREICCSASASEAALRCSACSTCAAASYPHPCDLGVGIGADLADLPFGLGPGNADPLVPISLRSGLGQLRALGAFVGGRRVLLSFFLGASGRFGGFPRRFALLDRLPRRGLGGGRAGLGPALGSLGVSEPGAHPFRVNLSQIAADPADQRGQPPADILQRGKRVVVLPSRGFGGRSLHAPPLRPGPVPEERPLVEGEVHRVARREHLTQKLAERDALLATELEGFDLPRVTMLETEYLRAVTQAELDWIDQVLAGLHEGSITWSREELQAAAAQLSEHSGSE